MVLNIYPLEQSLRNLAGMFGAVSSNREQISVFISMLKSLRFTFNHEELVSSRVWWGKCPEARGRGPGFQDLIIQLSRLLVVV